MGNASAGERAHRAMREEIWIMAREPRPLSERISEFVERYSKLPSRSERAVEREVFGTDTGVVSYTTPAQADVLGKALSLRAGARLLDVGAGTGWPGLYLSEQTGCETVLSDVPADAMRQAAANGAKQGLSHLCSFLRAGGAQLPFRSESFDAVVHADVL